MSYLIEDLLDDWAGRIEVYKDPKTPYNVIKRAVDQITETYGASPPHVKAKQWEAVSVLYKSSHLDQEMFEKLSMLESGGYIVELQYSPFYKENRDLVTHKCTQFINELETLFPTLNYPSIKNNLFFSGGALATFIQDANKLFMNHKKIPPFAIKDYDLYFKEIVPAKAFLQHLLNHFTPLDDHKRNNRYTYAEKDSGFQIKELNQEALEGYFNFPGQDKILGVISKHAITIKSFTLNPDSSSNSVEIQFITSFIGKPRKIVNQFDFTHSMHYFDFSNQELYLNNSGLQSLRLRKLRYNDKSTRPLNSYFRVSHFVKKGWDISKKESMKIMMHLLKTNIYDKKTLLENLTAFYKDDTNQNKPAMIESYPNTLSVDEVLEIISLFESEINN